MLKHWLRTLILLLGIPVLLGAGIIVWLVSDTNRLKPYVERVVTNLTNRSLLIEGSLDIEFGAETILTATSVRWINPAWSEIPHMLRVGRITATIDLAQIKDGRFVLLNARADNAELSFEWYENNPMNWDMQNPDKVRSTKRLAPIPLFLNQAELNNVTLKFRHPALPKPIELTVKHMEHQANDKNDIVANGATLLNGTPLSIDGRIGAFQELIVAGAIDYDINVAGPLARLNLTGAFEHLASLQSPDIDARYHADSAGAVFDLLGIEPITSEAADIELKLITVDSGIDAKIGGRIGPFLLDGEIYTSNTDTLEQVHVDFSSSGPSAEKVGRLFSIKTLPDAPYTIVLKADRIPDGFELSALSATTRGISIEAKGVAHKLPELRDFDVDLSMRAESMRPLGDILGQQNFPDTPMSLDLIINSNGAATHDSFEGSYAIGNGAGKLSGTLTEQEYFAGSEIAVSYQSADINDIAMLFNGKFPVNTPVYADALITLNEDKYRVKEFSTLIGQSKAAGDVTISRLPEGLSIDVTADSNGPSLKQMLLGLGQASAAERLPDSPWEFSGQLVYAGQELKIRSEQAQIGKDKLGFDGSIGLSANALSVNGNVFASGPNLSAALSTPLGEKAPDTIPNDEYSLSGALSLTPQGVSVTNIDFNINANSLRGSVRSEWPEYPERLELNITASGNNLASIIPKTDAYSPPKKPYTIRFNGKYDGTSIVARNVDASLGDAKAKVTGTLVLEPVIAARGVSLSIEGPRMSDLGSTAVWQPKSVPFLVTGNLTGNESKLAIDDFSAAINDSDLSGTFEFDLSGRPKYIINLSSNLLNLDGPLQQGADELTEIEATGIEDSGSARNPEYFFSREPIVLGRLNDFDVDLDITLDRVIGKYRRASNIEISGTLHHGLLDIPRLRLDTEFGSVDGNLHLDVRSAIPELRVRARAEDVFFSDADMSEGEREQLPRHDFVTSLNAKGASPHDLAGSLNGYFWINGDNGYIPNAKLSIILGDILTELFTTLNPFVEKAEYSELACDGAYLEITNGIVETAPAVILQTDKLSIIAAGAVDLASERINIEFKTTPMKGIGISASDIVNPFIKLGGTLTEPVIVLDPKNTAIQGGAAVATMGVSLLATSLWNRWIGSPKACDRMYEEAVKIRTKLNPADVPELMPTQDDQR